MVPGKETSGSPEALQHPAAPLSNGCLAFPLLEFTALMRSGGSPCVCVILWYSGASGLPGPSLPVRTQSSVFFLSVVFGFWIFCEGIDCPQCTGGWTQAEGQDVGEEKQ